jgi:predicted DsbA family dithiol-disulfide isomerase
MIIDIYADVVCPWCYIGERRLERALAQRPGLTVERRWRPFQLQPDMPPEGMAWAEFARQKFGGLERAQPIFAQVTALGAADGAQFAFDRVANSPNTRDAHRLILLAAEHGRQWELAEALFAAYFASGRNLSDREELIAIAAAAGLPAGDARATLAGDAYIAEVRASQAHARQYGIQSVPCYVIDDRYAISGAQPVEVLLGALDRIQAERVEI